MDPQAREPDIAATPSALPGAASAAATGGTTPAPAPDGATAAHDGGSAAHDASRRRFLRWLGGLTIVSTAAMILTPILGFLVPSSTGQAAAGGKVLVGTTTDIPPGAGKVVAMGSKPAVVVNTDQGVKAYSAICTHLGCVVAWNDMTGQIQCPCHGGEFNPANGYVVSGPPPAPLPPLTVSVENGQIFLSEA
jgi:cytochrome b6-f complex iron-sulfur subunit